MTIVLQEPSGEDYIPFMKRAACIHMRSRSKENGSLKGTYSRGVEEEGPGIEVVLHKSGWLAIIISTNNV